MNSSILLKITKAVYDINRPYLAPSNTEIVGNGFIIDIIKGLAITTFELVENSKMIVGRLPLTGRRDLALEVVSVCREKNLTLCKILEVEIITERISKQMIDEINLKFGDSIKYGSGDVIKIFSYSSNETLKAMSGTIFGMTIFDNQFEDTISRGPICFEIDVSINETGKGAAVLNSKGEVIGIISRVSSGVSSGISFGKFNIAYAIPSRSLIAIFNQLFESSKVMMPTLALEWCRTNREIMKKQTGNSSTYGFYVRKILPDSCLDQLTKGDIIRRIDYIDILWRINEKSEMNDTFINISNLKLNGALVTVLFDRFGMTTTIGKLKNPEEIDESKLEFDKIFTEKKLTLSEVVDMIPIGTNITCNLCRNQKWYKLTSEFVFSESSRIVNHLERMNNLTSYDYEIFAGMCVMNLDLGHLEGLEGFENSKHLKHLKHLKHDIYTPALIVVQIFPESYLYKTQVFQPGQLIKSVLAYKAGFELIEESNRLISNLTELRNILNLKPDLIQITTTNDSTFLIPTTVMVTEDKNIIEKYIK